MRAISTALNQTWEKTYWGLCVEEDCAAVFNVMDELMDTLRVTAPRVYSGVMRKISAL